MPPLYLCIHLRDFATLALTAFAPCDPSVPHMGQQQANVGHQLSNKGEVEGAPFLPSLGRSGTHAAIAIPAVAILSGEAPLERVFAVNSAARALGLACGMSRLQAESFGAMLLRRNLVQEKLAFAALLRCAGRFAPRVEIVASPRQESCGATLLLDISGCERLLGSPPQIASCVQRAIGEMDGIEGASFLPSVGRSGTIAWDAISVAVAHDACTAVLAARGLPGATAIAPGREAAALAPLPLSVLEPDAEQSETLASWGIRTLGQLAALEARSLAARLGQSGLRLQRQARGRYDHLLVPDERPADAPLCAAVELEHPVELLEPLLFLLNQLLEQVMAGAQQHALAIASVEVILGLDGTANPEDHRTIRPALPERDRLVLLKLVQLELEMHPPTAAVVTLRMVAHPAPPQSAQQGLFAAQAPEPGQLQILLVKLRKLAGEGRVGSPELLDSHAPEPFRMTRFAPDGKATPLSPPSADAKEHNSESRVPHICLPLADVGEPGAPPPPPLLRLNWEDSVTQHAPALRLLRPPRAVTVELRDGEPASLRDQGQRRMVHASSGPWRTSGSWWTHPAWCREEWEVCVEKDVSTGAPLKPVVGLSGAGVGRSRNESAPGFDVNTKSQPQAVPCCLRLAHDPASSAWYVIGVYD